MLKILEVNLINSDFILFIYTNMPFMQNIEQNLPQNEQNDSLNNEVESAKSSEKSMTMSTEIQETERKIEAPIKSINDNMFKLLSNHEDLLFEIKNKISKIPQKENQLFSMCGIIAWETANYFKFKDKSFYENKLKPFLDNYIYCVNTAKQKLTEVKFCELFGDLVENIQKAEVEEWGFVFLKLSSRLFNKPL